MVSHAEVYYGNILPIYLETVPGSIERICAAIAVQGEDQQFKVVRTLKPLTVTQLFGSKSEGINKAINWLVTSLSEQLKEGIHLAECELPLSGFYCSQPEPSAAQSINGLIDKTISLSTAVGGLYVDDAEKQKRFSTQLTTALKKYNKDHKQYINQRFTVGHRKVKFGLVTPNLIGQYHGIYANSASFNSAIVKMVALEDLKLDGLTGDNLQLSFYAARTEKGNIGIQKRLLSDLKYELDRREIPLLMFDNHNEMAEHFHSILSRVN
jgi:hypothetical protein